MMWWKQNPTCFECSSIIMRVKGKKISHVAKQISDTRFPPAYNHLSQSIALSCYFWWDALRFCSHRFVFSAHPVERYFMEWVSGMRSQKKHVKRRKPRMYSEKFDCDTSEGPPLFEESSCGQISKPIKGLSSHWFVYLISNRDSQP